MHLTDKIPYSTKQPLATFVIPDETCVIANRKEIVEKKNQISLDVEILIGRRSIKNHRKSRYLKQIINIKQGQLSVLEQLLKSQIVSHPYSVILKNKTNSIISDIPIFNPDHQSDQWAGNIEYSTELNNYSEVVEKLQAIFKDEYHLIGKTMVYVISGDSNKQFAYSALKLNYADGGEIHFPQVVKPEQYQSNVISLDYNYILSDISDIKYISLLPNGIVKIIFYPIAVYKK